jgi:hypothetical protein
LTSLFDGQDRGDDDQLPTWALHTPIRSIEWWGPPALIAALAALVVVGPVLVDARTVAIVTCAVGSAVLLAAAVVLGTLGRRAFNEQTLEASWRLHQTRVLATVTCVGAAGVLSVVLGASLVTLGAATAGFLASLMRPSAPRFEHVARVAAAVALGAVAAASIIVGFIAPSLPSKLAATWIGTGFVLVPVTAVTALIEARRIKPARTADQINGLPENTSDS